MEVTETVLHQQCAAIFGVPVGVPLTAVVKKLLSSSGIAVEARLDGLNALNLDRFKTRQFTNVDFFSLTEELSMYSFAEFR
jgi:hypothetical protein